MQALSITPAPLAFRNGVPFSPAFDDIYHAEDGGLAQARHVFLGGNDLPARWQGQPRFVIAETGFGLGLNFLCTWEAWRADPMRPERLHYVAVERFPFAAPELATLHARLLQHQPGLAALGAELQQAWPPLLGGFHRRELAGGRVILTLIWGDALQGFGQLAAKVDAFFLDGFAPAKNPDLWTPRLFRQFARLAHSGTTLATYTVAGQVRRDLADAGFLLQRRPGFGRKREMLCGTFRAERPRAPLPEPRHALIIGAGLAGASLSERLVSRGWHITLLERQPGPALGASGNHLGVFRPVVSLDDNLQTRLARAAFGYGRARLLQTPAVRHHGCGVLQLARDAEEARRFQAIGQQGWPESYLSYVDAAQASQHAGRPLAHPGLWFAQGGWVQPPSWVTANLAACGTALNTRYDVTVQHLAANAHGWQAFDPTGRVIAQAPVVILANAADAVRLAPELDISNDLRWLTLLPDEGDTGLDTNLHDTDLKTVVCRGGYITPTVEGWACLGSSPLDPTHPVPETAEAHNLQRWQEMLGGPAPPPPHPPQGRSCARPGTRDWLPIAGPLADPARFLPKHVGSLHLAPRQTGLYVLNGFGARGLVWSALLAELVASQIHGDPLPIERELIQAVDPARFLARRISSPSG